ncbi:MAG: zinc ribbon domain-containing protein [Halobacteriaceae archaeon]
MSKITFRADEDLVERVEALDASKSEVMRQALRAYLTDGDGEAGGRSGGRIDDIVADRVDELVAERLGPARFGGDGSLRDAPARDVNVTITVEPGTSADVSQTPERSQTERRPSDGGATDERTCGQCGEPLSDGHVYCPNCGEKTSNRVFCDCGDELRSDWAFCPSCGRRTPSADVLER